MRSCAPLKNVHKSKDTFDCRMVPSEMKTIRLAMKCFLLLFVSVCVLPAAKAQKPTLQLKNLENWPAVTAGKISENGAFIYYSVYDSVGAQDVHVDATQKDVSFSFRGAEVLGFTAGGRFICLKLADTLVVLDLYKRHIEKIAGVEDARICEAGAVPFCAYTLKNKDFLNIVDLGSGKNQRFPFKGPVEFSKKGTSLLAIRQEDDNSGSSGIWHVNLMTMQYRCIWRRPGKVILSVMDSLGKQAAFIVREAAASSDQLWYFSDNEDTARAVSLHGKEVTFEFDQRPPVFTADDQTLFVALKRRVVPSERISVVPAVKMDIWSYKDPLLFAQRSEELKYEPHYIAIYVPTEDSVIQFAGDNDKVQVALFGKQACFATLVSPNPRAPYRNRFDYYAINTQTGDRKLLFNDDNDWNLVVSPAGKYIICTRPEDKSVIAINTATWSKVDIAKRVPESLFEEGFDTGQPAPSYGIGGWAPGDEYVLLYDRYDIWKVDPEGKEKSTNLARGFGRRNTSVLRFIDSDLSLSTLTRNNMPGYVASVFNTGTKYNGFYWLPAGGTVDPVELVMEPAVYFYQGVNSQVSFNSFKPQKAINAQMYMLMRSAPRSSPTLLTTNNFQQFRKHTQVQPQIHFNWYTSELKKWSLPDGRTGEGIVYLPENFDSTKKYPVIVHFYEKLASGVYQYLEPEAFGGNINIPYLVSNGYIVFCPDIYYTMDKPGESAFASVMAAVRYMYRYQWFDSSRMGMQGHSFGGYEVNYIITHTNAFKAACSSAGASDLISAYGNIHANGMPNKWYYEKGQGRMRTAPWKDPESYIKNSPLFGVERVSTPLLIVNNQNDPIVRFDQGLEFFSALWQYRKQCWMLQYDNGSHGVFGDDAIDFTMRLTQFFDHYLKGKSAPAWMIRSELTKDQEQNNSLALPSSP